MGLRIFFFSLVSAALLSSCSQNDRQPPARSVAGLYDHLKDRVLPKDRTAVFVSCDRNMLAVSNLSMLRVELSVFHDTHSMVTRKKGKSHTFFTNNSTSKYYNRKMMPQLGHNKMNNTYWVYLTNADTNTAVVYIGNLTAHGLDDLYKHCNQSFHSERDFYSDVE